MMKITNSEWQPIETAPKDGTEIEVINGDVGGYCTEPHQRGIATWEYYNSYTKRKKEWMSTVCCDGVSYFKPILWKHLSPAPEE